MRGGRMQDGGVARREALADFDSLADTLRTIGWIISKVEVVEEDSGELRARLTARWRRESVLGGVL